MLKQYIRRYPDYIYLFLVCLISLLITYIIAEILPINKWLYKILKGVYYKGIYYPNYPIYQLLNLTFLIVLFIFYGIKKNFRLFKPIRLLLIGILYGYMTSLISYEITFLIVSPQVFKSFRFTCKEDIFGIFFIVFGYIPFYLLGWLYGAIMGIIIFLLSHILEKVKRH